MIHHRARSYISLAFIVYPVLGVADVVTGTVPVNPRISPAPESTLHLFSPKISLCDLRFVFSHRGLLFVELSQQHAMLYEDFKEKFPDFKEEDHMYFTDDLSAEEQAFALQHISETLAEKYCVCFLDSAIGCELLSLSGTCLYPSGDGRFLGFMGLLARGARSFGDMGFRPVALAFRSSQVFAGRFRGGHRLDADELDKISAFLRRDDVYGPHEVLESIGFYIKYPVLKAAAVAVRTGGRQYLFCVRRQNDAFVLVLFPHTLNKGLLLEDEEGETDITPLESDVFVLPDMDGDGGEELFVRSTISRLFEVLPNSERPEAYDMRCIREFYLGP